MKYSFLSILFMFCLFSRLSLSLDIWWNKQHNDVKCGFNLSVGIMHFIFPNQLSWEMFFFILTTATNYASKFLKKCVVWNSGYLYMDVFFFHKLLMVLKQFLFKATIDIFRCVAAFGKWSKIQRSNKYIFKVF